MFFFITHPHRPRVTFACNSPETLRLASCPRRRTKTSGARFKRDQCGVFDSCNCSYETISAGIPRHQRTRPILDIVNVSTIDPRRTVTLRFETPYPNPLESYTAESRLERKTIPYVAPKVWRDKIREAE